MVKRKTNFQQVYLVDKSLLNFQQTCQHYKENNGVEPTFQNSNGKYQSNTFPVNTNDGSTQTIHHNKLDIPNKYFLNDSQTQTNDFSQSNTQISDNSFPVNTNHGSTQTIHHNELGIPNEYFLNDSHTQTQDLIMEDTHMNINKGYKTQNTQTMQNDVTDVTSQTDKPYPSNQIRIQQPKSYVCQICREDFYTLKAFSNHLKIHKEHRPTNKMNSGFKNQKFHAVIGNQIDKKLKLNKSIASASRFVDGRNIHDWKNQYLCKICNIAVRTYSSLKSHVNTLHRSKRIKFDFPNNSKYKVIASVDSSLPRDNNHQESNTNALDIDMDSDSLQISHGGVSGNNLYNKLESEDSNETLKIRGDIGTSFDDKSNIMGPPVIRHDLGRSTNFKDDSNIMGPVNIREKLGSHSRFEDNSNIMGPIVVRNDVAGSSNFEDNSNIMGPIQVRNQIGDFSNFDKNINIMNQTQETDFNDESTDKKDSDVRDVTLVEDLQTYWCTKCEQFFRNFNSLRDHLLVKHNEMAILSKRSKTKDKVKRKIPFYSNYKK